ncbi:hypothetical protein [Azospirillum griseum]|uniref:N-acetyltransferase domain-containing protein n=1 Tax=Azospirillum griseum TaxID=2496639 RepID=A0A3S0L106_9PROT|nr:hypothetical protein [Azospirillum griseum]RTR23697.1 hypothetical protein EJ903_04000 [Azospirillum griseum]
MTIPPTTDTPASADRLEVLTAPDERVIAILVEAFRREPHNAWVFREDDRRDAAIADYLRIYLGAIAESGALFYLTPGAEACAVIGRSVEADHHFSWLTLSRLIPAVVRACSWRRVHRMWAMEQALSQGHVGLRHLAHGVFVGAAKEKGRSGIQIINQTLERHPNIAIETADPRVAALLLRKGFVENARVEPRFGGPAIHFLTHQVSVH